ncbi:MAG TPA: ABC transporter substrate-binding protein [bacterium]|nr:ABC transporter substrate-binding protein [bacterium]
MKLRSIAFVAACGLVLALSGASNVYAAKHGGVLRIVHRGNPPSLSIHQEATVSTVAPMMEAYDNLVQYNPMKPLDGPNTIIGDLASSWHWSKDGKSLTFKLHKGVQWHDGKPFTSADVKDTFDVIRGASTKTMKLNPRKLWYFNVTDITTNGDYEVTFHLKRPQRSLLSMLASGYSPVYPAHIAPDALRTTEVGTGPFMLKQYLRDQSLEFVKNPHYFMKGRPYLDGVTWIIIRSRPSRTAALQAGQVDMAFPGETTQTIYETLKKAVPQMVFTKVGTQVSDNILVNSHAKPFDNVKVRQAVNLALDRPAMIKTVHQGLAVEGGANQPQPYGYWGLSAKETQKLPGYGNAEKNRAKARKMLASLGYTEQNPLKVTVSTRAISIYVDVATWVLDQLKRVGIDGTLEQVETGNWHAKIARKDFTLAVNLTGVGPDDPDANFYENYACGSQRNYSDYCNQDMMKLFEKESRMTNLKQRLKLVHQIDVKLQEDVARPILDHRLDWFAHWPYVKGYVPHNSVYNNWRLTDVWLDK